MPSYNRCIFIGRLVRDPEKRYTAAGLAVTTFSIAVDRPFKDQATGQKKSDFIRCKAWRAKADFIGDNAKKGNLVAVEGRLETSENVGQDGQKRFFTDIVLDNFEFLPSGTTNRSKADGPANDYDDEEQPYDDSDPFADQ